MKPSEKLLEVLPQILEAYKQAVVDMPIEGYYEWLIIRDMEWGICCYATWSLGIGIIGDVAQLIGDGFLNDDVPRPSYTYEQNLKQIQVRIDWMESILKEHYENNIPS